MTSGNSCDVDMADYVNYLVDEPTCALDRLRVRGHGRRPNDCCSPPTMPGAADKPLVIYKMATGEQGAQAAMSHTGSLAGSQRLIPRGVQARGRDRGRQF